MKSNKCKAVRELTIEARKLINNVEAIPAALLEKDNWAPWRYELYPGGLEIVAVSGNARGNASVDCRHGLYTFEHALSRFHKNKTLGGVGIYLEQEFEIACVGLVGRLDDAERFSRAAEIMAAFTGETENTPGASGDAPMCTWANVAPTRHGMYIWLSGKMPVKQTECFGFDVCSEGFLPVTTETAADAPCRILPCQRQLDALLSGKDDWYMDAITPEEAAVRRAVLRRRDQESKRRARVATQT